MAKGITKNLDSLGRVTIPSEIRRTTGINTLCYTDLYIDGTVLRLRKGKGRKLDELGRYTIPKEIRDAQGWKDRQAVIVYAEFGEICICREGCFICGSTEDLFEINGILICRKHGQAIADKFSEE